MYVLQLLRNSGFCDNILLDIHTLIHQRIFSVVDHSKRRKDCGVLDGSAGYLYALLLMEKEIRKLNVDQETGDYVPYGGSLQRFSRKKDIQ